MSVSCPGGSLYSVQPGDTLFGIARRNGLTVRQLLDVNPQITSASILQIGQSICIPGQVAPPPCPGFLYVVVAGDTVFQIARRFGTTSEEILSANPGLDPNRLFIGERLCIPSGTPPRPLCFVTTSTDLVPASEGVVYVSFKSNTVFVMVTNVPRPTQLPGGQVYKAWLRRRTTGQYTVRTMVEGMPGVWIINIMPGYPVQEVESVLVSAEPTATATVPQGTGVATVSLTS